MLFARPEPGKNMFFGKVLDEDNEDAISRHCVDKAMNLLAIKIVSITDSKRNSYQCVFIEKITDSDDPSL